MQHRIVQRLLMETRSRSSSLVSLSFAVVASLLFLGIAHQALAQAPPPPPPNVIVILSDDAGYNEYGFQGSTTFQTPNLDALARSGTRFTQNYMPMSFCTPSRAGLLTGRYQQRVGAEFNTSTGSASGLNTAVTTSVAEQFKNLGYATGLVGKWHLGVTDGTQRPQNHGFDEFYGFLGGFHDYFQEEPDPNNVIMRNNTPDPSWAQSGRYLTDVFGDEASAFVQAHAGSPFFLMMNPNAVHGPLQAKADDLAQFPTLTGTEQKRAAMMLALDRAIGQVVDTLEQTGQLDNTMIVFLNDNGAPDQNEVGTVLGGNNGQLRGFKASMYEGGLRTPAFMTGPGIAADNVFDRPVSALDVFPTAVAAAGGTLPSNLDGVNLLPHLSATPPAEDPHEALFWRLGGKWAMRQGDWKLVRPETSIPATALELYNISTDPGETYNVAAQHPELIAQMLDEFTAWEVQLLKPQWGPEGVAVTRQNKFSFRSDSITSGNFSDALSWDTAVGTRTFTPADAYANAILEFREKTNGSYTVTNDMTRDSGLTFMLNELQLTGSFASLTQAEANIRGNDLLFVKNLAGTNPAIRLDALRGSFARFDFNIETDLILYNDLDITGNGNQVFRIRGDVSEMAGSHGIHKTGTSRVAFSGHTTFTGELNIEQGEVAVVDPNAFIEGPSVISIGSAGILTFASGTIVAERFEHNSGGTFNFTGGTLKVKDFVGNLVNNGGTYSPGASPALSSIDGDYTQTLESTLVMEIAGPLLGTEYDHLDISGILNAAGTLSVVRADGYEFEVGFKYDLFDWANINGQFDELDLPEIAPGLVWDTSRLYTSGQISVELSTVPEPSSLAIGSILAGLLLGSRRLRRGYRR